MSRGLISFPGRLVYVLICMVVIVVLAGCAPKLPDAMSPEDLQTCDDTSATIMEKYTFLVSPYEAKYVPYMLTPPPAEISSPLTGAIFPSGEAVDILFTQPAPDPNVSDRVLKVFVSPINSVNLTELPIPLFSLFGKVPSSYPDLGVNWTPASSGKFIILVMFWNLKNGGSPGGLPHHDFGPPSMAYVCVKIDNPKVGGAKTVGPVTMMPLQNITLPPTETRTATLFPSSAVTLTFTPTFTPTFTSTFTPFIPTFTSTFTPKPPTRVPPTDTPTRVPPADTPTPVIDCSQYDARTCPLHLDVCEWYEPPTAAPYCRNKP
jgi:hypothetical protein